MGSCRCGKCLGVLVVATAILIGFLHSDSSARLLKYIDELENDRGKRYMGMVPALHYGSPWGFTHNELSKLDLSEHIAVITGANSGLGYWTAYHLANRGAEVVLACRSKQKCDHSVQRLQNTVGKNCKVSGMGLDLASFSSIRKFAREFEGKYGSRGLDILILNAGILAPPFSLTDDGIESTMGVNHFGHFLLTKLLLPQLLKVADENAKGIATVVAVSSAGNFDTPPGGVFTTIEQINNESNYNRKKTYGMSKLANILFAQELSDRYKDRNILVNAVHPGAVVTDIARNIIDMVPTEYGRTVFRAAYEGLVQKLLWTAEDAALTQLFAAVSPVLKKSKTTGKYFHPIARPTHPDPHAFNYTLQKKLWVLSEQVTAM